MICLSFIIRVKLSLILQNYEISCCYAILSDDKKMTWDTFFRIYEIITFSGLQKDLDSQHLLRLFIFIWYNFAD